MPGHDDAQEVTIVRAIAADIRTAILLGVGILVLHGWWFVHSEHQADVISGFGVATAVLGILVAAQHLIKVGIETKARDETGTLSEEHEQDVDSVADKAARRIFRQEVVGTSPIAVGTLLNGYATALARLFCCPSEKPMTLSTLMSPTRASLITGGCLCQTWPPVWSPEWWANAAAALEKLHLCLQRDIAEDRAATRSRQAETLEARPASPPNSVAMIEEMPPAPFPKASNGDLNDRFDFDKPPIGGAWPADAPTNAGGFRELESVYADLASATSSPDAPFSPLDAAAEAGYRSEVICDPNAAGFPSDTYCHADFEHCSVAIEPDRFCVPSYRQTLSQLVAHVTCEAPIFEDVLIRKVSRAHGLGRAGRTVRDTILSVVDPRCARINEDGQSVIWKPGEAPFAVIAFRHARNGVRSRAETPLAELAGLSRAMHLKHPPADVVKAMAAELGVSRLEAATRSRLERAVALSAVEIDGAKSENDADDMEGR